MIEGPAYTSYLECLSNMNSQQFVMYMMTKDLRDIQGKEKEILSEKLRKLSDVDLLMLAKKTKVVISNPRVNTGVVMDVARERGFFDENSHPTFDYTIEGQANAKSKIIRTILPRRGIIRRNKFFDVDEETFKDEFEGDSGALEIAVLNAEIQKGIKDCDIMMQLSSFPNKGPQSIKMIQYINAINKKGELPRDVEEYIQYYICGLPALMGPALKIGNNDAINKAVQLKLTEQVIVPGLKQDALRKTENRGEEPEK